MVRNGGDAIAGPQQLGGPAPLLNTQGIKPQKLPPPRTFPKNETFPHDGREPPKPKRNGCQPLHLDNPSRFAPRMRVGAPKIKP